MDKQTSEICNYSEMKDRFDGEWVLVGEPETDASYQVLAGKVLWHSKDRDELYRKAIELAPRESAVLYFGEFPKDMEFAL